MSVCPEENNDGTVGMSNIEQPEPQFPVPVYRTGGNKTEFDKGRVVYVSAEGKEVSREDYEHWGGR